MTGPPYVAVEILCQRCDRRGKTHRLALFGSYTGPGADRTPWVRGFTAYGGKVRPLWWGPDGGDDKVKLGCQDRDCQHTPDVGREWITAQLAAVWAPDSRETRTHLR